MKKVLSLLLTLSLTCALPALAAPEVTDFGDIPLDRISASGGWDNFKWDGSGSWTTIDVTTKGVKPNTGADMAPAITNMINDGSGKRIFKFPAGTYNLDSAVTFPKGDVQLIGSGNATKFMLAGGAKNGTFSISGTRSGNYTLSTSIKRKDNKLTLANADGLSVGDYIFVAQPAFEGQVESQIVKILSKNGNTLTIDMNFGIPFDKTKATIEKFAMKQNIKLSNFYVERKETTTDKSYNISLQSVQNVEISFLEMNKAKNTHIFVLRARDLLIYGNKIHDGFGGSGGTAGGIVLNFSTKAHIINNLAYNLRHHYATQFGTDHCVIAYNRAEPAYLAYSDYGQHNSKGSHNNLFEGNYGNELYDDPNPNKGWGTRYTMWFRNHALTKIGGDHPLVEWMTIIGNELKGDASAIIRGPSDRNPFVALNLINVSTEDGNGTLLAGNLSSGARIPASLFLKDKPSYVSRWPLYGPDADTSSAAASSTPASSTPASSKPASSKPASSKPASSTPASSKPASSKPASSKAASSRGTDQCNTTQECKTRFGNRATDCLNSKTNTSVCMCGTVRCDR